MSAPKRVRLVDIAEQLNITKVSVSKALRDHPDISKDTRALVQKVAKEMGYTPNLVARSLSSQRSYTIGVVVPKIAHTFFASVIDAIQREATAAGYGVLLAVSNENADLERDHIERLLSMRVDGLMVSVSQEKPHQSIYEKARSTGTPLVFFDRKLDLPGFSSVTVDDREGARRAVDELVRMGYRRIAHIAGAPDVTISRLRRQGYEDALRGNHLPINEEWIVEGGFNEWHGYHAFRKLESLGELPDAIFAVTYPTVIGAQRAMWEKDPDLLSQIKIAAFGDSGYDAWNTAPHLTIRQPTEEIGRRSFELLLKAIQAGEKIEPEDIVLNTQLVASEATSMGLHGNGPVTQSSPPQLQDSSQ